eukprot:Amastigsp_a845756_26.p5 type:complete len:109 gc:universal Amastigsp_a845756_26:772-446(-)
MGHTNSRSPETSTQAALSLRWTSRMSSRAPFLFETIHTFASSSICAKSAFLPASASSESPLRSVERRSTSTWSSSIARWRSAFSAAIASNSFAVSAMAETSSRESRPL